ncbi:MAG: tetratricopeptide repeat protein [Acidobacteria bacterium]|nr:tetratricopeptide repeat protein [Acidobacteriota bacterium]MCI0719226.1 tetratricopeptide repeat protein [Acidobacteriota bacterium]
MISRLFSPETLDILLRPYRRTMVFLSVVGLLTLVIAAVTIRITLAAAALGESVQLPDLHRALTLDPTNPEVYHLMGLHYVCVKEKLNPVEAVKYFRQATELNPHVEVYWSDLASACELMGDNACADQAFERALKLNPMTPDVHWIAANHYLRTQRPDGAFTHFKRLLEIGPDYAVSTFRVCLQALSDPQVMFQKLLAANPNVKLKLVYVDFLAANGDPDSAYRVWQRVVSGSPVFPFSLAQSYLERLITLGRSKEAVSVWHDLERLGIVRRSTAENRENLMFNGDFEQVPLNAGFDWHYRHPPYLSLDFSSVSAYENARCFSLDFTVRRNDEYEPVYQVVPVTPGSEYVLTASVRSENITSDSGPRLRVVDSACASCLDAHGEATVGTTSWHPISLRFKAPPRTYLVRVSVWRERSRIFPTEISGRFWLDAVALRSAS